MSVRRVKLNPHLPSNPYSACHPKIISSVIFCILDKPMASYLGKISVTSPNLRVCPCTCRKTWSDVCTYIFLPISQLLLRSRSSISNSKSHVRDSKKREWMGARKASLSFPDQTCPGHLDCFYVSWKSNWIHLSM